MRLFALALTAAATVSFAAAPALAAPCKDSKGKFVKCAHAAPIKGKDGRCRVAVGPNKGKFTKC